MILKFVVHEVFKDLKFTEGDENQEMELCRIAFDDGYVTVPDQRILESAFISKYYQSIAKNVTLCQTGGMRCLDGEAVKHEETKKTLERKTRN